MMKEYSDDDTNNNICTISSQQEHTNFTGYHSSLTSLQ